MPDTRSSLSQQEDGGKDAILRGGGEVDYIWKGKGKRIIPVARDYVQSICSTGKSGMNVELRNRSNNSIGLWFTCTIGITFD